MWRCSLPVRVMRMMGVNSLVVTNAVGALNEAYQVGDVMVVKDHHYIAGLAGETPLRGPNDPSFGERFFPVNDLYNEGFRNIAKESAAETGMDGRLHEGVLTMSGGPSFESVAELRFLRNAGGDCVGMSNIPECLVAFHCGMRVLSLSLITNICATTYDSGLPNPNAQEVLDCAEKVKDDMKLFVGTITKKIHAINVNGHLPNTSQ